MEYYFDRDDRLERQKYAEFLKTLLLNCDKYRREDSDGAYVIALDSPWGTGKTRFVKMLRNHLEDRTSEAEKNRPVDKEEKSLPPGKGAEFNVIYYNAWDTDFCENALEPLLSTIVNSDVFEDIRKDAKKKEIWKGFVRFAKGALDSSVDIIPAVTLIGFLIKVFYAGIKRASEKPEAPFTSYKKQKELYRDFANHFERVIQETGKRLVIIVDELDRCRPLFAIQTLELAKHLFAAKRVAFIFAVDIEQLSYSAKTLYGSGMNTSGYLCRFFDYISKPVVPDLRTFIKEKLSCLQYYEDHLEHYLIHNSEYIAQLCEIFDLSLRDITTILSTYKYMLITFLDEYSDYREHHAYLFFLVIKYKNIELFNELFTETLNKTSFENDSVLKKRVSSRRDLQSFINALRDKERMVSSSRMLSGIEGERIASDTKFIAIVKREVIGQTKTYLQFSNELQNSLIEFDFDDDDISICWHSLIYKYDFLKWEDIKNLTVGQYIFRQLEMFDFVLPADEAKTEL